MFAQKVASEAAAFAPDGPARRDALCRFVGIEPDVPLDDTQMIEDVAFFELLERVAREDEGGRSAAIRVGASMRCDDYGAFGLAFKSAVDLWGSFQRVERYGKVVTTIANYSVVPGRNSAFMAVHQPDQTRLGLELTNELAISAATALSREVCLQDFAPAAVFFSHPAPDDLSAHEAHFQCPIHYGADRDGLEISEALLHAGNRLGDKRTSEFFDTHMDKALEDLVDRTGIDYKVRSEVAQALSEGVPPIGVVARRLGLSTRTLQRRLADRGCVYHDVVDTARRDLAERLLSDTEFPLAEVAFLTGYSEQSTFTRAFKRWNGQTPANYRRARQ